MALKIIYNGYLERWWPWSYINNTIINNVIHMGLLTAPCRSAIDSVLSVFLLSKIGTITKVA